MDMPIKQHILKIKVQPTMSNLEDYFNDLVEDGFTIDEALKTIVEGELVNAKLHQNKEFPCDEWTPSEITNMGDGLHEVVLEEIDWEAL